MFFCSNVPGNQKKMTKASSTRKIDSEKGRYKKKTNTKKKRHNKDGNYNFLSYVYIITDRIKNVVSNIHDSV